MNTTNTELTSPARRQEAPTARGIDFVTPVVDMHREADAYRLDVEMPGVPKNSVDLIVEGGRLIITGHRSIVENRGQCLHQERDLRDYRRAFDLDPTIDATKIEATMEQGLLRIRLYKAEVHQPRKIAVA